MSFFPPKDFKFFKFRIQHYYSLRGEPRLGQQNLQYIEIFACMSTSNELIN